MMKAVLVFPSISSIVDFVKKQCVKEAQVIASENKLLATLSDEQVEIAATDYDAIIRLPLLF